MKFASYPTRTLPPRPAPTTMPAPPVAPDSPAVSHATVTRISRQSLADFHALPEGTLAQYFDGEVLMSPAPLFLHQRVVARLHVAFARFVEDRGLGEVLPAPLDVTLSDTLVVQPDVVFISHARDGIVTRRGLSGAPDLVVEVLSPSTAYYDLTLKRDAYEAHGVDEYWIVDPERETVTVLAREDGRYRTHADLRGAGRAASALLDGFAVEAETLFGGRRR